MLFLGKSTITKDTRKKLHDPPGTYDDHQRAILAKPVTKKILENRGSKTAENSKEFRGGPRKKNSKK